MPIQLQIEASEFESVSCMTSHWQCLLTHSMESLLSSWFGQIPKDPKFFLMKLGIYLSQKIDCQKFFEVPILTRLVFLLLLFLEFQHAELATNRKCV